MEGPLVVRLAARVALGIALGAAIGFGARPASAQLGGAGPDEPPEDEPVEDEPAPDEPAPDEPVEDEPAPDEPVEDEPAPDEPVDDEPAEDDAEAPAPDEWLGDDGDWGVDEDPESGADDPADLGSGAWDPADGASDAEGDAGPPPTSDPGDEPGDRAPSVPSPLDPALARPVTDAPGLPIVLEVDPPARRRGVGYFVMPGVFAQVETGLGFVVHNELSFHLGGQADESWASRATFTLAYTTENQFMVESLPTLYWDDNRWWFRGVYLGRHFPTRYYAAGHDSPDSYQAYTESLVELRTDVSRNVWSHLYVGAMHYLRVVLDMERGPVVGSDGAEDVGASDIIPADLAGFEPGLTHGLGAIVFFDYRDDIYFPLRGGRYEVAVLGFSELLGSDYEYAYVRVDLRQFVRPFPHRRQTLGFQVWHEARFGAPPFHMLAELGGPFMMRGWYQGRYRDLHQLVLQTEYRAFLVWRLVGVVFANVGETYGEAAFRLDELRWSVGTGLRVQIGERIFVRLDVGFTTGTSAFIFNGGQAF